MFRIGLSLTKIALVGVAMLVAPPNAQAAGGPPGSAAAASAQVDHAAPATTANSPSKVAPRASTTPTEFAAPPLTPITRSAFGIAASKAPAVDIHHGEHPSSLLVNVLWGVTIALAVTVIAVAFWLGRLRSADGSVTRGLTLGSKLTLAMGSLAVIILTVGTMSLASTQATERLMVDYENIVVDANHAMDLQSSVYLTRMATRDFQIDRGQQSLDRFTEVAGHAVREIEALQHAVKHPETLSHLDAIHDAFERYEQGFIGLVGALDAERAIIDSQLEPTGAFLSVTLESMLDAFKASGDAQTALKIAEEIEDLSTARLSAMRYLETGEHSHIEGAFDAMEHLTLSARSLAESLQDPRMRSMAGQVAKASAHYNTLLHEIERVEERAASIRSGAMAPAGLAMISATEDLHTSILDREHEVEEALVQQAALVRVKSIAASTVAVLVALVVSVILIRAITNGASKVLSTLQAVAGGDLTLEPLNIRAKDEIGAIARATDSMSVALREVMEDISSSASGVASASTEIAASNEEMSAGLAEQSDQVNQVSAAAEEMSMTSQEVASKSTEGKGVVEETISRIEDIANEVKASASAVNTLGKKSEEIGQIIAVINDIADQTNLLALNAAIEAARAGEHGRGFAVVADEVRKLAERTTQATEQVGSSIREIQSETEGAVRRMEGGTQKVQGGVEFARQAGDALSSIVAAAEQQSAATIEISQSVEQINSVAMQSKEGAQQAAAAAAQLSAEAEKLQALVKRFKV
ncbi:MAG: methyl-accepting chemotaxis protein [Phycisphaerales bacterium]